MHLIVQSKSMWVQILSRDLSGVLVVKLKVEHRVTLRLQGVINPQWWTMAL